VSVLETYSVYCSAPGSVLKIKTHVYAAKGTVLFHVSYSEIIPALNAHLEEKRKYIGTKVDKAHPGQCDYNDAHHLERRKF
jgi:hypothetical protein